ncbi:HEAT repeat domain-containing protein [Deinococcus humi]|uniref:HEAT repeat domain-containing protein n=1 Tax=Deinococcus humi TaxID=662880 RepID=A0A7W8K2M8_9DEIO|nr:HEAT repeat domain-containing protein [Deinococcus humi]MBB5366159.1 hypothetical protein [Deinococcus humi]GGO40644.1 hypothetical protein GCM10008949_50390 [Deinococcus humi]
MIRDEAIAFLRAHQPLPTDDSFARQPDLARALLTQFHQARKYFEAHPDADSLPLLLGSCGDKSGFGHYQLLDGAFMPHPAHVVVPHLISALRSPHLGVRFRAAELSALFSDDQLVMPLLKVYQHGDIDEQDAALLALTQNRSAAAREALRSLRPSVTDTEHVELLDEYFGHDAF